MTSQQGTHLYFELKCESYFINKELWQKHKKDPMNVPMWVNESERCVIYYIQYGMLDLNSTPNGDMPFIIGIQTKWQMQMMIIHGNKRVVSFYATFRTNTQKVLHSSITKYLLCFA
jgi:hypothetical protein